MLSSHLVKSLIHRLLLAVVVCCLLPASIANAQQEWSNEAPTYTALPPQGGPFLQGAQANPNQPFANPPQTGNFAPQTTQQPMQPAMVAPPQVGRQMVMQAEAEVQAVSSSVNDAVSSSAAGASGEEETSGDITDGIAVGAEKAKNTFVKAIFENDRKSQMALATKYVLPVVAIFLVMFVANWIGSYLRDTVSGFVSRRVDVTLGRFAGTIVKFVVVMSALMGVLAFCGAELTSLAALIAALGFAVGMALQGTLGNFASGVVLLVFRPFSVGDYIVVDGAEGTVHAIELFTTSIDTHDNRRIILPNESVFGNRIENWNHHKTRRVDVLVGVTYSADMKQTRRVLLDAMATVQGAIPTPSPSVYLNELNASSVDWSCRVWCRSEEYLAVRERVTEAAKDALDRNGIGIPFPQLDLHVVTPNLQQRAAA